MSQTPQSGARFPTWIGYTSTSKYEVVVSNPSERGKVSDADCPVVRVTGPCVCLKPLRAGQGFRLNCALNVYTRACSWSQTPQSGARFPTESKNENPVGKIPRGVSNPSERGKVSDSSVAVPSFVVPLGVSQTPQSGARFPTPGCTWATSNIFPICLNPLNNMNNL